MLSILAITLLVTTSVTSQNYVKASDTVNQTTIVVPDEVIYALYSINYNGKAYQGDTIVVKSLNDLQFKGFKSQKIVTDTRLFYSQKEKKNVVGQVTRPLSKMTTSWGLIIFVFLYYLVFGYLILKARDTSALVLALTITIIALALTVIGFAFPGPGPGPVLVLNLTVTALTFANKKIKPLFFLFSLVGMGITSYFYATPLFIVCCAVGLALALVIRSREVSLASPQKF